MLQKKMSIWCIAIVLSLLLTRFIFTPKSTTVDTVLLKNRWRDETAAINCSQMKPVGIPTLDQIKNNTIVNYPICGTASFGNFLSAYIESRICANLTGMHLVSVTMPLKQRTVKNLPYFFPKYIYNPAKKFEAKKISETCKCDSTICHENPRALLHAHPIMVRDITPWATMAFFRFQHLPIEFQEMFQRYTSWRNHLLAIKVHLERK